VTAPDRSYDLPGLAELYDHVRVYRDRRDSAFYVDQCRAKAGTAARVLELGCGTGRILLPIARAGCSIVGLDRSRPMLDRLRTHLAAEPEEVKKRVRLHEGDMRDFELTERFDIIIAPFRSFQHLVSVDDQLACLKAVRRHLARGGKFIVDVFNPDFGRLAAPWGAEHEDTPDTPLPNGRHFRRTSRVAAVHRTEQYSDVEIIYYLTTASGATDRVVQKFPMRWFLRFELEHLLARSGLAVRDVYGTFDRGPLRDDSPEIIVVAERVDAVVAHRTAEVPALKTK
jgi:SAM-dependent methyltransferase